MRAQEGLSQAWMDALSWIERHQQSRVFMPAALWVALDMIEDGLATDGKIAFADFERLFSTLLERAGLPGGDKAWEPFFHLSHGAQIWALCLQDRAPDVADVPRGRPKSRSRFLKIADSAQIASGLRAEASDYAGRERLRDALLSQLLKDDSSQALALVSTLREGTSSIALCQSSDEIAESLRAFNRDAFRFKERARELVRATQYWVWDAETDSFGPGKFVGYQQMSFPVYQSALAGYSSGARFDGNVTQRAIRRAIGADFNPSTKLADRLRRWADRVLGADASVGVSESKWLFIRLPSRRRYWGLLVNPAHYRIEEALRNLKTDSWTVPTGDLSVGDRIAFWRTLGSDGRRGIIALGEVLSSPALDIEPPLSARYWTSPRPIEMQRRVAVRYVLPPKVPLWLSPESRDILLPLSVSRAQGTKSYRIDAVDWWRLVDALGGWSDGENQPNETAHDAEDLPGEKQTRRNPRWADAELILALELYLREGQLDAGDQQVLELSKLLNGLPIHSNRPDAKRFRNPNGVALKLANFAALDPAYTGRGMDRGGKRDAEIWEMYSGDEDRLRDAAARIRAGDTSSRPLHPLETVQVSEVPIESLHRERFQIEQKARKTEAERREHKLMHDYQAYLTRKGHQIAGHRYDIAGYSLRCDLFDKTEGCLYEAKGNVTRESIRMAIGQLLDYARFHQPRPELAVLLPRRPSDDLCTLLRAVGVTTVYRKGPSEWDEESID